MNDHEVKSHFDGREFTLRFPTIDDIVQEVLNEKGDPVVYKTDVARLFRNLKVDLVDALKFSISWDGLYFLDRVSRSAGIMGAQHPKWFPTPSPLL